MDNGLETKIEERRKQAEEKKIGDKASAVARYLGDGYTKQGRDIGDFTFRDENFVINNRWNFVDWPAFGTGILYSGKEVYREGGGSIYAYVPGEWEKNLEGLYKKALRVKREQEKEAESLHNKKKAEAEAEERKKWGL